MGGKHVVIAHHVTITSGQNNTIHFSTRTNTLTILPLPPSINAQAVSTTFSLARTPISLRLLTEKLGHCGMPLADANNIIYELLRAKILTLLADSPHGYSPAMVIT